MNTYQEKLFTSVNQTLASLRTEQAQRISQQECDQFNLYFAQGASQALQTKLNHTDAEYNTVHAMHEQAVTCNSQSDSLINAANLTDKNTKAAASLAQKSAQDIQLASNSVAHLAADIGSALNIVFASDYGSDIAAMSKEVNHYIREAAYNAENTAQKASEAATAAAEITPGQIKAGTSQTSKAIKTLLKETQSQTVKLNAQKEAELVKFSEKLSHEKLAFGALQNAESLSNAARASFLLNNSEMNQNFQVQVIAQNTLSVVFEQSQAGFSGDDIPIRIEGYYIVLVKAEKRHTFNPNTARALYQASADRFYQVTAGQEQQVELLKDADGDNTKMGIRYVAFLFSELTAAYKQFTDDQNDLLAAPSNSFVLQQSLPSLDGEVQANQLVSDSGIKRINQLTMSLDASLPSDAEVRLLLIRAGKEEQGTVLIDDQLADREQTQRSILMTTAIAESVAMSGYLTASKLADNQYQFSLSQDLTDNFSAPVLAGVSYRLAILVTANAGTASSTVASTLSFADVKLAKASSADQSSGASKSSKAKNKKS